VGVTFFFFFLRERKREKINIINKHFYYYYFKKIINLIYTWTILSLSILAIAIVVSLVSNGIFCTGNKLLLLYCKNFDDL